jgi:O-antigen/teichoic acid export membrane protein
MRKVGIFEYCYRISMKKTTLIGITMDIDRDQQDQGNEICLPVFEQDISIQIPRLRLPSLDVDRRATRLNPRTINSESLWSIPDIPTMILPVIHVERIAEPHEKPQDADASGAEEQVALLRKLATNSGIYALSSIAVPLISLVLAPFLTHHLSLQDYGALAITNTAIGLGVGITQLGLSSAFFRAYGYDYSVERDRHDVVATVTTLLCLVSIPVAIVVAMLAPWLAGLLFGHSSLGNYISLAGGVVLLQNLTVPGMAWLRAESRPLLYSLLSIGNLLVTLIATIFWVGVLNGGVPGAIIANGLGYACIVICTIPIIILRTGIKIRADMAKNLLAFGLPLVVNFISYWVLQLMDRYLLSLFVSLAETAKYTVVYTLGSAMSVVIIGPFTLAWPTVMFSIAKRKDAIQVFKLVFRWLSMLLLFAAFGFSLVATFILDWLFPAAYHSVALVIPVVTESLVFYGLYFIFMAGANIQRKTWLAAVFTTIAAVVNVALNLVLIPLYGAMGAAAATLIAFIVLALAAYIANQRLYPIPFEIGKFIVALLVGVGLYVGSSFLALTHGTYVAWGIYFGALALYGGCLALLGKLPVRSQSHNKKD